MRLEDISGISTIDGVARGDFIAAITASVQPTTKEPVAVVKKPPNPMDAIKDVKAKELEDDADAEKACVVCLTNEKTIGFIPCGHICCCPDCARNLGDKPKCPVCRAEVTLMNKMFSS